MLFADLRAKGYDLRTLTIDERSALERDRQPRETFLDLISEYKPSHAILVPSGPASEAGSSRSSTSGRSRWARDTILEADGVLLARFSPAAKGSDGGPGITDFLGAPTGPSLWDLAALGPPIEIYRIKRAQR
ncbi:MAG: hypothetical protein ACI9EF_003663 [Pseudohongiellaceae bacterium]